MEQKDFKISRRNYAIIIQKANLGFAITQSNDDENKKINAVHQKLLKR